MEWLNKIDDAIDSALKPRPKGQASSGEETANSNAEELFVPQIALSTPPRFDTEHATFSGPRSAPARIIPSSTSNSTPSRLPGSVHRTRQTANNGHDRPHPGTTNALQTTPGRVRRRPTAEEAVGSGSSSSDEESLQHLVLRRVRRVPLPKLTPGGRAPVPTPIVPSSKQSLRVDKLTVEEENGTSLGEDATASGTSHVHSDSTAASAVPNNDSDSPAPLPKPSPLSTEGPPVISGSNAFPDGQSIDDSIFPQKYSTTQVPHVCEPNLQHRGPAQSDSSESLSRSGLVTSSRNSRIQSYDEMGDGDLADINLSEPPASGANSRVAAHSEPREVVPIRSVDQDEGQIEWSQAGLDVEQQGESSTRNVVASAKLENVNDSDGRAQRTDDSLSVDLSLPDHVEIRSEFDPGKELLSKFRVESLADWDPQMNCYGAFHVRIVRAQRLQCPVGSSVQGIVSLLPWKGKVWTSKAKTFSSHIRRHGVCVRWDEGDDSLGLVHAYASDETPVPVIKVDVVFNPLGLFDVSLCSVSVSCQELMINPSRAVRQWFQAVSSSQHGDEDVSICPLIEIEAVFEPADPRRSYLGKEATLDEPKATDDVAVDLFGVAMVQDKAPTTPLGRTVSTNGMDSLSLRLDDRSHAESFGSRALVPASPHMLRIKTFWTPATCAVCKRNIRSGLTRVQAFHCEECGIDCCSDCRLQVDVKLPCGSEAAEEAKERLIQNRLTLSNVMSVIAPVDELLAQSSQSAMNVKDSRWSDHNGQYNGRGRGVGRMRFEFVRALVFERTFHADTGISEIASQKALKLRRGDYYVRVSWTGDSSSKRTRTMQSTGRPQFDSNEMEFIVPHYGIEFRIDLVDATTDKPVGSSLVTTQALLLQQRDMFTAKNGVPLLTAFRGPPKLDRTVPLLLELRTGLKSGFGLDFFNQSKVSGAADKIQPGEIVGTVELRAGVEEDYSSLFGESPYDCPSRPPDELNMAIFQLHLARLLVIVESAKEMLDLYMYLISWKNPLVTLLSLIVFIRCTITLRPEHLTSFPVLLMIVRMVYLAFARSRGRLKNKWLRREVEKYRKSEKVTVGYNVHRPAAVVCIGTLRGRNLRSPELGLPGNVYCRVFWDPTRYAKTSNRHSVVTLDVAASVSHDIATTQLVYSINPSWETLTESPEAKRMKHLLPSSGDGSFFDTSSTGEGVEFPVLQPIKSERGDFSLERWSSSAGALVFDVRFQETISLLPGSEYSLGEVAIPMSKLSEMGEISGWFRVLEVGTDRIVAAGKDDPSGARTGVDDDYPQVYVQVKWKHNENKSAVPTETEKEASFVIQEELMRSVIRMRDRKLGLIGSSLGAFNTVRGLSDNLLLVQNTLGSILDILGAIQNALNFSDPFKSCIILYALILVWIFLSVVPTRLLIFVVGLGQFIATFFSRFGRHLSGHQRQNNGGKEDALDQPDPETNGSPYRIWFINALRGLPTDEDIRKTYFWECRRLTSQEVDRQSTDKRQKRLARLWRSQWNAVVEVVQPGEKQERISAFSMIQGHRFLWWRSLADFDEGEEPLGRIFLAGHAGLATPSPLELRLLTKEDVPLATSIFGRGSGAQERVTVIVPSAELKAQLEMAMAFATSAKNE